MTSRRERRSDILWVLVAIAIVIGGVIGFRVLGALREPVAAADTERSVPLVESVPLAAHQTFVPVGGEGFVRPWREVALAAETSGRVVALHPAIVSLGRVREGEVLVRLDDRSARAALTRAESDIASTRARLELNATQLTRSETLRSRGVISQEALDQRLAEKAELSAALSSLESARDSAAIALEKATIVAPFDARARARDVEVGAVVSPGAPLLTLFTAERLEVTVPLGERAAALVPALFSESASGSASGTSSGAAARVVTTFAGREIEHSARVVRVAPALDPGTRMLDVTVALESDSARVGDDVMPAGVPPALLGSYARVVIEGGVFEALYALPSSTIRGGDHVWLVVADGSTAGAVEGATDRPIGRFLVHPAETLHVEGATSYTRLRDLPTGARLVTGVVDAPIHGMRVRELRVPDASSDDAVDGEQGEPPRAAARAVSDSSSGSAPDAAPGSPPDVAPTIDGDTAR